MSPSPATNPMRPRGSVARQPPTKSAGKTGAFDFVLIDCREKARRLARLLDCFGAALQRICE